MKILLSILLLFFINSCSNSLPQFPCNTKDQNSECFINPPEGLSNWITKYDINVLKIFLETNPDVEEVYFERFSNSTNGEAVDTTSNLVSIFDRNPISFYDSLSIDTNLIYSYSIQYSNTDGDSDPSILSEYFHDFVRPNEISISSLNAESIDISWSAINQFSVPRDSIYFVFDEYINGIINYTDTLSFKLETSEPSDTTSSFNIIRDINTTSDQTIEYNYIIREKRKGSLSKASSKTFLVDIPEVYRSSWLPLDSKSIFLYWEFDQSTMNENAPYNLKISRDNYDILNGLGEISFESSYGSFVDTIPSSNPGDIFLYILEWCTPNGESCGNAQIKAATFPVNNMIYIPSFTDLPTDEFLESNSSHFYIDKYEVSDTLFNSLNSSIDIESIPFDNPKRLPIEVNYNSAYDYAQLRDPLIIIQGEEFNIEFNLPDEKQWKIAAGVGYEEANLNSSYLYELDEIRIPANSNFYHTSVQSLGLLNCNYANIISCNESSSIPVGSFSENAPYNYQISTSPNGLYDCSGNLMEWVITQDNDFKRAMGGFYNSVANSAQTSSYMDINSNQLNGVGFRTIIDAEQFLSSFKELVNEN